MDSQDVVNLVLVALAIALLAGLYRCDYNECMQTGQHDEIECRIYARGSN